MTLHGHQQGQRGGRHQLSNPISWWTFRIFLIFSARGGGRGSLRRQEGGGFDFYGKSQEGGLQEGEGPGGCLRRIGDFGAGGGLNIFFSGPKCPPRFVRAEMFERKFLANGRLRQNSLAITNAMAWCTQPHQKEGNPEKTKGCSFSEPKNPWRRKELFQNAQKIERGQKGRFRKRVVLANVPSFRFSFPGNMRTYPRSGCRSGGTSECTLVPVFVPGEHLPKPPFWKTTLLQTSDHSVIFYRSSSNTFFSSTLIRIVCNGAGPI